MKTERVLSLQLERHLVTYHQLFYDLFKFFGIIQLSLELIISKLEIHVATIFILSFTHYI